MATQPRPVAPPEPPAFHPYVPPTHSPAELTVRAVVLGAILGIVFAASSVYLALKIGLTVSASIPIAVLAVAFFRTLGKSTILQLELRRRLHWVRVSGVEAILTAQDFQCHADGARR